MANETECKSCPVCSSTIEKWRVRKTSYGSFKLDVCRSCGFAFVNPRPTLEFLMEFYASLGYGGNDGPEQLPTKASVLAQEQADPNSTLDAARLVGTMAGLLGETAIRPRKFLDIGCGYGFFSVDARQRGFEVTALDLATNKRKVMEEMTGLQPVASSFEDFECAPSSFSAVLMSQVLEHVSDINQWVAKANGILAEGGVLAIALPNFNNPFRYVRGEKSPYIIPPEHLNFFSSTSLSTLLQRHGFKVEKVEWVSRVPMRILKKRLPGFATPVLPVFNAVVKLALASFDAMHLGMMVNVYGRKIGK